MVSFRSYSQEPLSSDERVELNEMRKKHDFLSKKLNEQDADAPPTYDVAEESEEDEDDWGEPMELPDPKKNEGNRV
jgi:hypothetical protein